MIIGYREASANQFRPDALKSFGSFFGTEKSVTKKFHEPGLSDPFSFCTSLK
jgi:hypothetical protein